MRIIRMITPDPPPRVRKEAEPPLPIIIAVDFDGTLCWNKWPRIGKEKRPVIDFLISQKRQGVKLILWTMRDGEQLDEAVAWCRERGLEFDAVNDNLREVQERYGNNPRKVFANYYLDDHNL